MEKKEENNGKSIYDRVNKMVESVKPEDCNIIFLPFLNGSNNVSEWS